MTELSNGPNYLLLSIPDLKLYEYKRFEKNPLEIMEYLHQYRVRYDLCHIQDMVQLTKEPITKRPKAGFLVRNLELCLSYS